MTALSVPPMRGVLVRHAVLLVNAGALAIGNLTSAALGFVYWWFAAHAFSAPAVGYAAAAVSLMNLLAHLGEVGLGPFLTGELGRHSRPGPLLTASLTACALTSGLLALSYLTGSSLFETEMGSITSNLSGDVLFVTGCMLTGVTIVLDQAFVGLLRGGLQMGRNALFSVSKLVFLLALAFVATADEFGIFATWVVGQGLSMLFVAAYLYERGSRIVHRPNLSVLRPVLRQMAGHHVLNVAIQAPNLVLPFLVTVVLSPEINAAFYAAWTLVNVALLVPASLAAVLFSVAMREPHEFGSRLRLSLGMSGLCAAGAAGLFFLFPFQILSLFSQSYADLAGEAVRFLGFGVAGVALKYHYLAIQRIRGRLGIAAWVLSIGALMDIAVAASCGIRWGLAGVVDGWVACVILQGVILSPILLREVRPRPVSPATREASSPTADPSLFP